MIKFLKTVRDFFSCSWINYKPCSQRTLNKWIVSGEESPILYYLLVFIESPWGGTTRGTLLNCFQPCRWDFGDTPKYRRPYLSWAEAPAKHPGTFSPRMRQRREGPPLNCLLDEYKCRCFDTIPPLLLFLQQKGSPQRPPSLSYMKLSRKPSRSSAAYKLEADTMELGWAGLKLSLAYFKLLLWQFLSTNAGARYQ